MSDILKMIGKKAFLTLSIIIVLVAGIGFFYFIPWASPKLSSPPTDVALNTYVNQTVTYKYESHVESIFGASIKISIDHFSEELTLTTLDYKIIPRIFPYAWEVSVDKGENISYAFHIVASKPGNYIIALRFSLSYWVFSQEYQQKIFVNVSLPKPPAQIKPITILLNKLSYTQGEPIMITIINNLNESIIFNNTACELRFEVFNGTSWVHVRDVPGDQAPFYLNPEEKTTIVDMLYLSSGIPFPPGKYRVGTRDIYAEFSVVRPMT